LISLGFSIFSDSPVDVGTVTGLDATIGLGFTPESYDLTQGAALMLPVSTSHFFSLLEGVLLSSAGFALRCPAAGVYEAEDFGTKVLEYLGAGGGGLLELFAPILFHMAILSLTLMINKL
jgi:hypothetical protein